MSGALVLFVASARCLASMWRDPALAARWSEPSALPGYTLAGLAGHTARAAFTLLTAVTAGPPASGVPVVDAVGYLAHIPTDSATTAHGQSIRDRGTAESGAGHEALADRFDATVDRLAEIALDEPDDRLVGALGMAIRLDEYVRTRLVELVVHADDLAVSAGTTAPACPAAAMTIVFETLTESARRRHGDRALLRALTRRERANPAGISVF